MLCANILPAMDLRVPVSELMSRRSSHTPPDAGVSAATFLGWSPYMFGHPTD